MVDGLRSAPLCKIDVNDLPGQGDFNGKAGVFKRCFIPFFSFFTSRCLNKLIPALY